MDLGPWYAVPRREIRAIPSSGRLKAILLYRMTRSRDQSQKHTTELSTLMRWTQTTILEEWPPVEMKECKIVSQGWQNFFLHPEAQYSSSPVASYPPFDFNTSILIERI